MAVVDAEQVEIVCAVAEGAAYCLLRKSDRGKEASLNHPNDNAHTTNNSNEEKEEKNCTEARAFLRLLLDCVEYYLQSDAYKPTWRSVRGGDLCAVRCGQSRDIVEERCAGGQTGGPAGVAAGDSAVPAGASADFEGAGGG